MSSVFWERLDALLAQSRIVIDRPRGSHHPRFPQIVYDGEGVDVWIGSDAARRLDAVICTVDMDKRDAEMKLMVGCTEAEKSYIERFYNGWPDMGAIVVRRRE